METLRYDAGAAAYDRLTGRWSRLYAPAVLDAAGVASGNWILDVATGTGDAALLAAARLGEHGTVVAVDLSVPMLLVAGSKPSQSELEFVATDAQALPFAECAFDAVICLFGLMFFPEQIVALKEFRRVLCPGGRVALTVWGPPGRAPFAGIVAEALSEELSADREDLLRPFALANPRQVEFLLSEAGFGSVSVGREIREARFASFDDFWEPVEAGGGRLGQAYIGLSHQARAAVRHDVKKRVATFATNGEIVMELEAYIATGAA